MNEDPPPVPARTPSAEELRKERLAAALRDNLKRRKQQNRARKADQKPAGGGAREQKD